MPEPSSDTDAGKVWSVIRGCLLNFRLATIARCMILIVLLGSHALSLPETPNSPTETVLDGCRPSEQIFTADELLWQSQAPTHFRLMNGRYVSMVEAMRGHRCTGTVTVAFDGRHFLQTAKGDDPGLTELIPTLSRLSGLTLANAYDLTIIAVILLGLLVGYAGLWKLHPDAPSRWICAVALVLIGLAEARVADVYIFQVAPFIAGIPWLLYFALTQRSFAFTSAAALLAFCCSCCSLVRSGSIAVCATFLIASFILRYRIQRSVFPLLLVALACVLPVLFQQSLIARRGIALARMGLRANGPDAHTLWHTAYLGLAFIPNSEVPRYLDDVAFKKVRSIDPTVAYGSVQYETTLRNQVWSIFKRKPMIVIENLAAKACIVTLLGLCLLLPARKFIFAESELLWFDIAFLLSAGMSAVNAIVAVPRLSYLLTFISLCALYSCIKFCRGHSPGR